MPGSNRPAAKPGPGEGQLTDNAISRGWLARNDRLGLGVMLRVDSRTLPWLPQRQRLAPGETVDHAARIAGPPAAPPRQTRSRAP